MGLSCLKQSYMVETEKVNRRGGEGARLAMQQKGSTEKYKEKQKEEMQ